MALKPAPDYVSPHGLLEGRSVLVTAAAGAGIGFAAAKASPRKVAVPCSSPTSTNVGWVKPWTRSSARPA
jgi:hypothetical protein